MRIVHLLKSASWSGGVESYVLSLAKHLEGSEIDLTIVAESQEETDVPNVLLSPRLYSQDRRSLDQLRDLRPDLVHCHITTDIDLLSQILKEFPTVVTAHGYQLLCPAEDFYQEFGKTICESRCGLSCFSTTAHRKCMSWRPSSAINQFRRARWGLRHLNHFSGVISPCHATEERFLAAGLEKSRSHVIPYFCPVECSDQPRPEPKSPQLTFLGRIRDYKGFDYFVDVVGRVEGVTGVMVGDFNDRTTAQVMELATLKGCADRIECRPWCSRQEVSKLMAATSVFLFPSIWPETLGIVGLEAMASGVPVVAFDVAGPREWLKPGITGYFAPCKDSLTMAGYVRQIINDKAQSRRMGEAAIEAIKKRFLPEHHVASLIELYSNAIEV